MDLKRHHLQEGQLHLLKAKQLQLPEGVSVSALSLRGQALSVLCLDGTLQSYSFFPQPGHSFSLHLQNSRRLAGKQKMLALLNFTSKMKASSSWSNILKGFPVLQAEGCLKCMRSLASFCSKIFRLDSLNRRQHKIQILSVGTPRDLHMRPFTAANQKQKCQGE